MQRLILPSVTDYPATPEWFSFPHIAISMVPVNKRHQHHKQTLTACVTHVLNLDPRPSIDGTCRPASRAALTGLLTVVFRGSSQSLGSRLRFQLPTLNLPTFPLFTASPTAS